MARPSPRRLPALVAVVLLAAACTPQGDPTEYGEEVEDNFRASCEAEARAEEGLSAEEAADYCRCAYEGMVAEVPFETFRDFDQAQGKVEEGERPPAPPESILDVTTACEADPDAFGSGGGGGGDGEG